MTKGEPGQCYGWTDPPNMGATFVLLALQRGEWVALRVPGSAAASMVVRLTGSLTGLRRIA